MGARYRDDKCDEAQFDEQNLAVGAGQKFSGADTASGHERHTGSDEYWQKDRHEDDPYGLANPCYQVLCSVLANAGFGVDLRLHDQREDKKSANPDRRRNQMGKPYDGPSVDQFVFTSSIEIGRDSRNIDRGCSSGLLQPLPGRNRVIHTTIPA